MAVPLSSRTLPSLPPWAIKSPPNSAGEVEPRSRFARIQFLGIGRGVVAQHSRGTSVDLDERIAPVGRAVPVAIAGGDENAAAAGIDHSARTTPDGRLGLRAGVWLKQLSTVAHSEFHTCRSLPELPSRMATCPEGRPVADVARRNGNPHVPGRISGAKPSSLAVASLVMEVRQTSWPALTASFWI